MRRFALALLCGSLAGATLSNGKLTAEFNDRGLMAVGGYHFSADNFSITIDGHAYDSASLPNPTHTATKDRVLFTYTAQPYTFLANYELRPDWHFLSKKVIVRPAAGAKFRIDEVQVFRSAITEQIHEAYVIDRTRKNLGTEDYGVALRFDSTRGMLAVVQNPFLKFRRMADFFSLSYEPDMPWDAAWGDFESDVGLFAPYRMSDRWVPAHMTPEWSLVRSDDTRGMNQAEVDTFTDLVRAFLLYRPKKPLNIMVGWCANDYQIDIATPEGRAEYKRIMDTASTLGADHLLFAPANSELSRREDSTDDWHWEYVLWLGLGQKIRKNEWDTATGPIPRSVQEMLEYARSKHLGLVAYVYPVLGFGGKRGDRI